MNARTLALPVCNEVTGPQTGHRSRCELRTELSIRPTSILRGSRGGSTKSDVDALGYSLGPRSNERGFPGLDAGLEGRTAETGLCQR
jgi:hypothetical protein